MPAGRSSSRTATAGTAAAGPVATAGRPRPGRRAGWRRPAVRWGGLATVVLLTTAAAAYAMIGRGGSNAPVSPTVGADLHTVAVIGDAVYLGGHEAVVVSADGGRAWRRVRSLDGADAMGWAVTAGAVWVGGHPGLYRSTDGGATLTSVTGAARVDDVHALGAAAGTLYLASPKAGLLASTTAAVAGRCATPQPAEPSWAPYWLTPATRHAWSPRTWPAAWSPAPTAGAPYGVGRAARGDGGRMEPNQHRGDPRRRNGRRCPQHQRRRDVAAAAGSIRGQRDQLRPHRRHGVRRGTRRPAGPAVPQL